VLTPVGMGSKVVGIVDDNDFQVILLLPRP
jgi:hypothetical protein